MEEVIGWKEMKVLDVVKELSFKMTMIGPTSYLVTDHLFCITGMSPRTTIFVANFEYYSR